MTFQKKAKLQKRWRVSSWPKETQKLLSYKTYKLNLIFGFKKDPALSEAILYAQLEKFVNGLNIVECYRVTVNVFSWQKLCGHVKDYL